MATVKIARGVTEVLLSLSEREAGRIMSLLMNHVDFGDEPWAREVHEALESQDIAEVGPP
jgi:hypothetical protein